MIERILAAIERVLTKLGSWVSGGRTRWRWLGYLLTTSAMMYLAYVFIGSGRQLRDVDFSNYLIPALASLGVYFISLVAQFIVWARMISFHKKADWEDVGIYSKMILMRRLPGGPWHWVGRAAMYSSSTEVPARVSTMGSLVEWLLILLVGAAFFFAVLEGVPAFLRGLLVATAIGLAIAIGVIWQPGSRRWILRFAESGLWIVLYAVAWLAGLIIFLVIANATGAGLDWVAGLRVWTIAAGLAVITVVLPFTLGIQEATLAVLLQPYLDPLLGLVVALMIRLLYIAGDALWGFLGWQLSRLMLRRRSYPPTTDKTIGA
ncbi:MAG: hypothetical protein ACC700_11360 [Anaerolineales bacterium]